MFYYSNESKAKVVHYEGCHHLRNIKKKNLRTFDSVKDVLELHHENSFEKDVMNLIDSLSVGSCVAHA